jgi:hypothetical protein
MGLINLLENEYELYGVRWKQEPHIIMTDFGEKQLRYWKDESTLKWHVKWRDESSKGSGAVPDRMIRTRDGETAVFDGKYWITLHDYAETLFGCEEVVRWGQFIGQMLKASIQGNYEKDFPVKQPVFDFNYCLDLAQKYQDGTFQILTASLGEAKKRLEFAEALNKKVQQAPVPILEKEISIANGKRIFHFLFYQGGDSKPVVGYMPIRNFLFEWLENNSPLSLKMLLTEIDRIFPLDGDQGLLLLAEITTPWELKDCLSQLDNSSLEKMVEGMNMYQEIWDANRTFLKTVTEWFDENRRKVAL